MPERYERLLRLVCFVLGGLLLVRFGWIVIHHNPLAHLKIPAVPTLAATEPASGAKGTNSTSHADKKSTNAVSMAKPTQTTNSSAGRMTQAATNAVQGSVASKGATNAASPMQVVDTGTNAAAGTNAAGLTNAITAEALEKPGSNVIARATKPATNAAAGRPVGPGAPLTGAAVMMNQPPGMPGKARELAPEMQARVDRISDSEILGPVMHPLPMALLGIAGNIAFLRAPNGQTGLVKEGDDLGGVKLIRIGINRVLVEQEGQKKELMIFSGLGGQSLLTNELKSPP